jgi:hypothetical protein
VDFCERGNELYVVTQTFVKRLNKCGLVKLVLELWNQLKVNDGIMEY